METPHTTINIPKSPVAARRTSPRRDQPASPNVHRRLGAQANETGRAVSPTAARRTNLTHVTERDHATPILPHGRNRRDVTTHATHDGQPERMQPLLETDANNPLPPIAGPEIDDLDEHSGSIPLQPQSGIDDGLLEPGNADAGIDDQPDVSTEKVDTTHNGEYDPNKDPEADPAFPDDGNYNPMALMRVGDDVLDYGVGLGSIPNGLSPRAGGDDVPYPYPPDFAPGAQPRIIPDVNVYQQKKNLAQGMMDLALLSANANQLRYVWESFATHPYFYPSVVFISMSLILQIAVGVGLIWNSRYNVKDQDDICKADRINNLTVIGIFLITIVNVFIASFGVGSIQQTTQVVAPPAAIAVQTTG